MLLCLSRLVEEKRQVERQLAVEQQSHAQHSTAHADELHALRNELLLKAALCADHTDSLAAAQQQLTAARAQLDRAAERERDGEGQAGYLEEQRRELQRQVEELGGREGEWRERERERRWLRAQLDELHDAQQQHAQQMVRQRHASSLQ